MGCLKLIELEGICDVNRLKTNIFGTRLDHKNKSGTTGVYFSKDKEAWYSFVQINGKKIHLGIYKTKEEAIMSRENAIKERDEFVALNKIIDIDKMKNIRKPGSPRSDNTSGVTGVSIRMAKGKQYILAQWNNLSSVQCSKSFSVEKYGFEEAFRLAKEYREFMISELIKGGAEYAESHGK